MNRYGQAARFAYNPVALVAYFDALERPRNWRSDVEGRIQRRWRTVARGVTMDAGHRMFACYSVSHDEFTVWCRSNGYDPVLRDTTRR